jgi:putative transposase
MYLSNVTDSEWSLISGFFERKDARGRKSTHSKRIIVNAILYCVRSGCQCRMLPKDFPPWKTVYGHFSVWNKSGVWEPVLDSLNSEYRQSRR